MSLRTRRRARAEAATRVWVRSLVRSGLRPADEVRAEAVEAIRHDHPWLDAESVADAWIGAETDAWTREAAGWREPTDHDRLQAAFAELARRGFAVLQGCADHWAARAVLDRRGHDVRGVLWFVPQDVWHAIDAGMLEVNLWHPSGANAAEGDALLDEVLRVLADHGLSGRFDEGRVEVGAWWHVRPGGAPTEPR